MLELRGITKVYPSGGEYVRALKGVDLTFGENEFVSILGPSGCGKTTLLNIIGGLDRFTEGDLIINGVSTKEYKDRDWDAYRNHSVGFVFQTYNLIPHQTVLANVELALTLSGVSKQERRSRAKAALEKVGLGDQLKKKPNQMSGGQMQRVAIARALVNDPDILLADEPTGALDSETSIQVMEILKEVASDRLVIMVTHNPDLAKQYSTRIVHLADGKVTGDSGEKDEVKKVKAESQEAEKHGKKDKKSKKKSDKLKSMSFLTAVSLSFNNLLTKKGRTMLTSFAGSIGIIGIALIMALSNGVQVYISSVQREALSNYPLTIESQGMDMSSAASLMTGGKSPEEFITHGRDKVYSNTAMEAMVQAFTAGYQVNNLAALKEFFESDESGIKQYVSDIQYTYATPMNIYSSDTSEGINKVNPSPLLDMAGSMMGGADSTISTFMSGSSYDTLESYYNMWKPLLDNKELLKSQYDLIAGSWPEKYNEVVLIVDPNNEVTGLTLQALGLSSPSEMIDLFNAMQKGEEFVPESVEMSYEEVMDLTFRIVLNPDYYSYDENEEQWVDMSSDPEFVSKLIEKGTEIRITGILRPTEGSVATMMGGTIGYLSSLTEYIVTETEKCELVKKQKAEPENDVFTGLPFPTEEEETEEKEAPKEESTTAPEKKETAAWEKPSVSYLGEAESGELIPQFLSMSESELYAWIDQNVTGEQHATMTRMAQLVLKDVLTISERKELASLLDAMLAGQNIQGVGSVSGSQAVGYITLMTKQQKLDMLEQVINSDQFAEAMGIGKEEEEAEEEGGEEEAEAEPVTEPEPEPEPEPLCKSYDEAMSMLGVSDMSVPLAINIYPTDFEAKDAVTKIIEDYNQKAVDEGREEDKVVYTDYIGIILSSVTKIIDIVTYVLMAFVAISLVVSSIMIGVITNISVLERTKEIGVLRSIGASKHDISRVFNAETFIIGLISGALGIGLTVLLIIPINILIDHLTDLNAAAILPPRGALILVCISMVLTVISGLIPARNAARKDPVVALRTE